MEQISSFWQEIVLSIGAVLISIIGYFIIDFKSNIEKVLEGFTAQIKKIETDICADLKESNSKIEAHRDAMGKCTKAINGDMLEIRKSIASFREDVAKDLIKMKDEVAAMNRQAATLTNDLKLSATSFNDKFGAITRIQKQVNKAYGQIIIIDEKIKKIDKNMNNHQEAHLFTKEILQKFRQELNEINKPLTEGDV